MLKSDFVCELLFYEEYKQVEELHTDAVLVRDAAMP